MPAGLSPHAQQRSGLIIWEPAGGRIGRAVLSKGKKHVQDNRGPMSRPNGRYRDRVRPYCRVDLGCRSHCLEYGRQQSHWHVLDRCKETLGRNIIGIGGGVPHHHPLAFGSVGELHNRWAARRLPVLYAIAAATCSFQIAAMPLCASILDAMPSGKLSSRIIVPTLRALRLKYC